MQINVLIIALLVVCSDAAHAARLYGLERMERFDQLPSLQEGTRVKQVSGYDRDDGNDDGFNGTYSSLYIDDHDEYVMFDEIGAGCIYRFWMTYDHSSFKGPVDYDQSRLRFYFDNEDTPRLDISIDDFFDGVGAPFEFPLVGRWEQSSHGCYCYVPFPYRERLKITLSGKPYFYNITYHRFDDAEGVTSWTGTEDQSGVLAQWNAVGENPNPTNGADSASGILAVSAGSTGLLFRAQNAGVIQGIKLDPDSVDADLLTHVWIKMNWDGGEAEVLAPLGDFFGSGYRETDVQALPLGMTTNGFWYCYFPMPYWESAEIQLINDSVEPLTLPFEILSLSNAFDRAKTGYFHAAFHERTFISDGTDFNFIDETGRGHVVGVSLRMHGTGTSGWRGMTFLEGDERAYIDGERSPCLHGTGNEDYFNAGWYFDQGTFSRPYHGCTHRVYDALLKQNFIQAYRFHLGDALPFYNSIKFGIEHGPRNTEPGTYSSVVYYYKQFDDGFGSGMLPVADLDPGDPWNEGLYDYVPSNAVLSNVWQYTVGDESLGDVGYNDTNLTFRLPLLENDGVLLRRRIDMGAGVQQADVYVDDAFVGTWYEPDLNYTNTARRWIDSEFQIPSAFTINKESALVRLVSSNLQTTNSQLNTYHLWAYAVQPLIEHVDSDHDGIPDDWELGFVPSLEVLSETGDNDRDGLKDVEEFLAGTNPTLPNSSLVLGWESGINFETHPGRLYRVEQRAGLVDFEWTPMLNDFLGTGRNISVSNDISHDVIFYRVRVFGL